MHYALYYALRPNLPLLRWLILARARTNKKMNDYSHVDVPINYDIRTSLLVPIDSGYAHELVSISAGIGTYGSVEH